MTALALQTKSTALNSPVWWRSVDELRSSSIAWDALWQRSEVASPICRAEPLALWHEAFAHDSRFQIVGVRQEGRLVAGLPLVARSVARFLEAACLPSNWGVAMGDLLLDPTCDQPSLLDALMSALARVDAPLVWLEGIAYEEPRWQNLLAAAERHGWGVDIREQHRTAQVEIQSDWNAYFATRTSKHRNNRRAESKRLEALGQVRLRGLSDILPGDVQAHLQAGFELESRSWKHDTGTCVLQDEHLFRYFCQLSRELAKRGQLHLMFLDLDDRPIAFSFGWQAKQMSFGVKIGCDAQCGRVAPGHQLLLRSLQQYHQQASPRLIDFVGPLAPWHESWATRTYPVGRVVLAQPNRRSQALLYMYRNWQPRARWIANRIKLLLF